MLFHKASSHKISFIFRFIAKNPTEIFTSRVNPHFHYSNRFREWKYTQWGAAFYYSYIRYYHRISRMDPKCDRNTSPIETSRLFSALNRRPTPSNFNFFFSSNGKRTAKGVGCVWRKINRRAVNGVLWNFSFLRSRTTMNPAFLRLREKNTRLFWNTTIVTCARHYFK